MAAARDNVNADAWGAAVGINFEVRGGKEIHCAIMATAVASPVPALQDKGLAFSHAVTSNLSKIDQYYEEIARRQLPEATGDSDAIECAWEPPSLVAELSALRSH